MIAERMTFHKMKMKVDEKFEQYVSRLKDRYRDVNVASVAQDWI